ncbi:MAG: hypothetical protein XD72_1750 [Methanothrix harundinacea]|uniref:Uncharacterized protein n=1 Tax=Methanothrix harundinacea TaxID=301375 RepID=A0A101FSW3_9EURY|nr:MAG: hypothetical protein XD72_1750 [Methanothrix harundinacea]
MKESCSLGSLFEADNGDLKPFSWFAEEDHHAGKAVLHLGGLNAHPTSQRSLHFLDQAQSILPYTRAS